MALDSFQNSFHVFISTNKSFSTLEKETIHNLFHTRTIQVVFKLCLALTLWSFVAIFFDSLFLAQGVVTSIAFNGHVLAHFIPALSFMLVGIMAKSLIIYFFTKNTSLVLSFKEKLVALIPVFGFVLFTTMLLRKHKILFVAFRSYFGYLKHNARWVKILFQKNQD